MKALLLFLAIAAPNEPKEFKVHLNKCYYGSQELGERDRVSVDEQWNCRQDKGYIGCIMLTDDEILVKSYKVDEDSSNWLTASNRTFDFVLNRKNDRVVLGGTFKFREGNKFVRYEYGCVGSYSE